MNFRTYKFYGNGYSTTDPTSVIVFFNGEQIYAGPVPTINSMVPRDPAVDVPVSMFQAGVDITRTGDLSLTIIVTKGTLKFSYIEANYSGLEADADYSDPSNLIITYTIEPANCWGRLDEEYAEVRKNVKFNGIPYTKPTDPAYSGDWDYIIPSGTTFECDVYVNPNSIVFQATPEMFWQTDS